jgi:ribonuclease D
VGRIEGLPTRFVDTDQGLAELVAELAEEPRYAIDTEFHRERTYFAHLALVQVAWSSGIAVIDPLAIDLAPFAGVLKGQGLAILHAADQDLEVLERSCGCVPREIFDTQIAAGFIGFSSPSLSSLVERLLGVRLEKGDQLTDWTRRPLSASQLTYAESDVAHLLELHDVIVAELEKRGRRTWAEEECAIALERARSVPVPEHAWWKLRQARQLRPSERAVAQQVAAWRERRAQEIDQPVRHVVSDLALVAIAHRPPKTLHDLETVRNMDARHLQKGVAEELLAAVQEGLRLPKDAIELPPAGPTENVGKPAVSLALSWISERARALDIDPAILATRADLIAFLKDPPEGRLVHTWRETLLGEPIRRLFAGDASLALTGDGIVLEERSGRAL